MSDNNERNDISAEEAERAERIKAIRNAIRAKQEPESENVPENAKAADAPDITDADGTADAPETADESTIETLQPLLKDHPAAATQDIPVSTPEPIQPIAENAPQTTAEPEFTTPPVWDEPEKKPKKKSGKKKKKKKSFKQKVRGLFPEKGDSILEIIRKIVFLISIIAIIVCGYMVGDYYIDLWRSRSLNDEIADIYSRYPPIINNYETADPEKYEEKYYDLLPGAKKLLDINSDVVGFMRILTVDGDPTVELPVVQAADNFKYLDHNFKGEESRAGALFLDWRNKFDVVENHRLVEYNSENLVIYGHNMADDSMFGTLKYYERNYDYYENHPLIELASNYEVYTYKIFAFFIVDACDDTETKYDCWNKLDFGDEGDFYYFVNEAKKRTLRLNDVDVKYGDPLLTLSTCNYLLGDRSRLIVMARRLRPGEEPLEGTKNSRLNDNVKYPTMYYNTKYNEKYNPDAIFIPYGPEDAVKEAQAKADAAKKKKEQEKKEFEESAKSSDAKKDDKKATTTKAT